MNSQEQVVIDIQKSPTQRIRVSHRSYKGRRYVDVRLLVVNAAGDFVPTQKGLMVRPELLPQVIQGLTLAAQEVV
ncbi:transcriptional coactivator p15/PC4 family protein [Caballeronia sp. LZ035]|uniref:transcriptional coactivator p15/PC4 family protein n=1 Tax=Caballeronia sp. LZ035 TaxID=3038568 RepID=UPI0028657C83|nr:transcriptional coactivator p15/PC4 family protein [Caballeronia sp. LZ035]MDR5755604.1 transcriptional coactivator p15/PC4 family protein [Caballeronia sp. LZ035]